MIEAALLADVSNMELKKELNAYINSNIEIPFIVARDNLSMELSINDIIDYNNFDLSESELTSYFNTAFDIVVSESVRDLIKPIYKYFIYQIIEWFVEVTDNANEYINSLDEGFVNKIKDYYGTEEAEYILEVVRDLEKYNEIIFDDWDFLSPTVEEFVQIYLKNQSLFRIFFSEIDLNDYVPLMPKDLKEQYLEYHINSEETKSEKYYFKKLTQSIIRICEMIQSKAYMREFIEDQFNDNIRDGLELKGYIVRDQTRVGESGTGISSGEADILVFNEGIPITIIESLVLHSLEKREIEKHIKKIYKYDKRGNFVNYFISFVKVKDFKVYWEKYKKFIGEFDYSDGLLKKEFIETNIEHGIGQKCALSILERSGIQTLLFHIVVHL